MPQRRAAEAGGSARTCSVLIVTGSIGSGHDHAAKELARQLLQRGVSVDVVDFLTLLPRPIGWLLRSGYAFSASRAPRVLEWIFTGLEHRSLPRWLAQKICDLARSPLRDVGRNALVVIATYPLAVRTIGDLRESGKITSCCLAYLPDPAPHAFWLHPALDSHLAASQCTVEEIERRYALVAEHTGPLVAPEFRASSPSTRGAIRAELGLQCDEPLVLVTAGSLGIGRVDRAVDALVGTGIRPVVLCGRNEKLMRRVVQHGGLALAWRDDVAELMRAADAIVQNAGGVTTSEALVIGVPCISFEPIGGHGRANVEILDRYRIVPLAQSARDLVELLRQHGNDLDSASSFVDRDRSADVVVECLQHIRKCL